MVGAGGSEGRYTVFTLSVHLICLVSVQGLSNKHCLLTFPIEFLSKLFPSCSLNIVLMLSISFVFIAIVSFITVFTQRRQHFAQLHLSLAKTQMYRLISHQWSSWLPQSALQRLIRLRGCTD